MKLGPIGCAVLALACQHANAQTNVTLYGVVDLGVSYDNASSPGSGTWSVTSGQLSSSRLGLRGSEDLGNGMRAVFTLESGFNADDGTLANGGRLWGRQAFVGIESRLGNLYLGRQYTATYLTLRAIDPFKNQQAGDTQRVYGYGLGKVEPLSRTDNTVTWQTPTLNGLYARFGYKAGESADGPRTNSSKYVGLMYEAGALQLAGSWQDSDRLSLGAADTQTGAIVAPTGLGATVVQSRNMVAGGMLTLGKVKLHAGAGHTRLRAARDTAIRNTIAGITVDAGTGTILASWNRIDVRDMAGGASNQYAAGYVHPLGKRTDLYSSASLTRNDDHAALNAALAGKDGKEFRAGIRHTF